MLILIKKGYGEYDDYYENVVAVLDVNTTKTIDILTNEHQAYLIKLMADNNIPIAPNQPWALPGRPKSEIRKLYKKLWSDNDFLAWIKATYPVIEITNFAEHNI